VVQGEVEEGAWIEPNRVQVGEGSRIERGAIVRGPTIIGRNTVVRSGAYIRGHVLVGDGCMIGHGTETRQILVLNQSNIPHKNCIFTSLIGNRVNIGGLANTANFLLTGKPVAVHLEVDGRQQSYATGQTLFGAIIGDDSKVGGNILMQPGTIIGRRCLIYPQFSIWGFIPHDSVVRAQQLAFEVTPRTMENPS
jgi:UDP-N-acetylglucosamine diphosphorylase / glucose-1-phosphate thymidylyltransferase / UDP-N-acetylgalactosamine diphosphorylase / glucosamine-1-phosphate N-acetyltransferase / galactosamine-1-phosphate N-acetyltransferase